MRSMGGILVEGVRVLMRGMCCRYVGLGRGGVGREGGRRGKGGGVRGFGWGLGRGGG